MIYPMAITYQEGSTLWILTMLQLFFQGSHILAFLWGKVGKLLKS
jgi:hypothetical protein